MAVEDLAADRIRRDALLWNFTVLGEAAAQLSAELKQEFADVAWRQPARLRNRIVHGYWSIDLDVVHATTQEQLPGLTAELKRVLADLDDQDDGGPRLIGLSGNADCTLVGSSAGSSSSRSLIDDQIRAWGLARSADLFPLSLLESILMRGGCHFR